jgi:hypothetical protein
MESEEFNQPEEIEDEDDFLEPGCDADGFPNAEEFNAAIAEGSGNVDADDFDEDFESSSDLEDRKTMFDTLPEMDIIRHNLEFS